MKNLLPKLSIVLIVSCFALIAKSQITEMNWQLDYKIYLRLANDSNYTYDIKDVFHVNNTKEAFSSDFIFYPVYPEAELANSLPKDSLSYSGMYTLWSALHSNIGGGWIHFTNCIAYALETQKLNLQEPLMERPVTEWKPKPMTDTYKRTKNWKYYIPLEQKNAKKEYKRRISEGTANDLKNMPDSYIKLFLKTSQKEYDNLLKAEQFNTIAKIDLIKILLGAKYLSQEQINYISHAVVGSVVSYSSSRLPSVIIFDDYEAAAVMSLNIDGYKIEKVAFKASAELSESEKSVLTEEIFSMVSRINEYNNASFKKQIGNYYKN